MSEREASDILPPVRDLQQVQASVFMRAGEVFGDSQRATAWMEEPNPALRDLPPLRALLLSDGQAEVLNILGRIEDGVLS